MAFPDPGSKSELQAVNQILASVGQAPVTTLEQTNPDVAIAYDTLTQVSREVQAEGWTFNKEYCILQKRNTDNEIDVADNVLQMKLNPNKLYNRNIEGVLRTDTDGQRKFYERVNHTYTWKEDVYVDILWLFSWDDLPPVIQDFIVSRAAAICSMRMVGDSTQYQALQQQEAYMRAQAVQYETEQGEYTFFGHPEGQDYYISYKPYHALYR